MRDFMLSENQELILYKCIAEIIGIEYVSLHDVLVRKHSFINL
jgi:hypothetical protein